MKDAYQQFLTDEYTHAGVQNISFCQIGDIKTIIPVSYQGNVDNFIDDLFNYHQEAKKYENHNQKNADNILDPKMIKVGGISFLPPFDLYSKDLSIEEITERTIKRALRQYRVAVKKTKRAKKEYAKKNFLTEVSHNFIARLDKLHQKYVDQTLQSKLKRFINAAESQAINMTVGALGALPAVVYTFLDKKVHFAENKTHGFIKKKLLPYIFKGAVKDFCLLSAGVAVNEIIPQNKQEEKAPKKVVVVKAEPEVQKFPSMDSNQTFKISDEESFDNLFNLTIPFAIKSLLPTEILMCKPYSDGNTKAANTIGIGNYFIPENYNPETYDPEDPDQNKNWIKTSEYLKKHPGLTLTGEQAYKLAKGAIYRFKDDLYALLKGAELTIPQFTAIISCMYNSPDSANKLCDFVAKNYKDPYKCAEFLLNLKPGKSRFNNGIAKRHTFEALLYLNPDNFADKLDYLLTNDDNKTTVSTLDIIYHKKLLKYVKNRDDEGIKKIAKIITTPFPIKEKTLRDVICENRMDEQIYEKYDVSFEQERLFMHRKQLYENAKKYTKNKQYTKSMTELQAFLATGAESPAIHNCLAENYYHLKYYGMCLDECAKVINTGNKLYTPEAYYCMGKVYQARGRLDLASNCVKAAITNCNRKDTTTLKIYQKVLDYARTGRLLASANNVHRK